MTEYAKMKCDNCQKTLGLFSDSCDDPHYFFCSKECLKEKKGVTAI